jgi:hypothetical protein
MAIKGDRTPFAGILAAALVLAGMVLGTPPPAPAQQQAIITVTTTAKVVDFGGAQQVGDLPGPDGRVSVWEAVIAANNTPGGQAIHFNIPTSDGGYNGSLNQFDLEPPLVWDEQLILTDDGTVLDGSTQPGGATMAMRGTPAVTVYSAIRIESSSNTVRGFFFAALKYGIEVVGDSNVIADCSLLQNLQAGVFVGGANNTIGGTSPADRNLLSGNGGTGVTISGDGATGNRVLGNYIGTVGDGLSALGNYSAGVSVGGSNNTVGGTQPGARNVISGNGHTTTEYVPAGAQVALSGSNNRVIGNYIGLDAAGAGLGSVASSGVEVTGSGHTIGGTEPGAGNVIASNNYRSFRLLDRPAGIRIAQRVQQPGNVIVGATDILVQGNFIGTDATGTSPAPNSIGIRVDNWFVGPSAENVVIGGSAPGAANVIAFNDLDGFSCYEGFDPPFQNVRLSRNSIHSNGELGIDLADNRSPGVTQNDAGDVDVGSNLRQNFPVIISAVENGSSTTVSGIIDTPSPASVTIEVFTSVAFDPGGYGEGEVYRASATPNMGGAWTAVLPAGLTGLYATATATDAGGNTSEFSQAVAVTGGPLGSIVVTSPNGGESWQMGSTKTIGWSSMGVSGNVTLSLSRNGGASYDVVVASTENDGTFDWSVTGPATAQARVRVTGVVNTSHRDESNGVFTIAAAPGAAASVTPGIVMASTSAWFLRLTNTSGGADMVFSYGPAGNNWIPIAGDWDGDGDDSPGFYDPDNGVFFLKLANEAGPADLLFGYGPAAAGWLPVVGDWDGNGTDTVGLYSPSNGFFFLRNANAPGGADVVFGYGPGGAGWQPLAGDWNGDGTDTVGLYRAASGSFLLKNANTPGPADLVFGFGPGGAAWTALAGDWNGDGIDTVGLYVPSSGVFFLRNASSSGPADLTFGYGPPNAMPVVGDWDG